MARRLLALPALALLFGAVGCATAEPGAATSPSPSVVASTSPSTSASPSPSAASTPTASPTPTAEAADVTVAVTIAGGKVTPNAASVRVKLGQTVQVTAVSDVEDSIHVHGYDKTLTVGPGGPAEVRFTADQPGVFEVETHDSHKLAAKLIVS